jgi:acetyltransferase-like isoleucine patch superfamily enzyme
MTENSHGKIRGFIKISIIAIIVFSLGFLPVLIFLWYFLKVFSFDQFWHYLLIPLVIYISIIITYYYQLLFNGLIIHIFNIKYEPGVYEYTYQNKMSFKWIIICTLYTPFRNFLEIFPLGGMKCRYLRFLGMKLGDNSLVGGTIMDPCLTEMGDNCTMGLFAVVYGHIHDFEKGTISFGKIKIGNNCVIGAGSIIMPDVILEDNVKIAAGAIVPKDSILKKGRTYAGIPAKEIKTKKKKK